MIGHPPVGASMAHAATAGDGAASQYAAYSTRHPHGIYCLELKGAAYDAGGAWLIAMAVQRAETDMSDMSVRLRLFIPAYTGMILTQSADNSLSPPHPDRMQYICLACACVCTCTSCICAVENAWPKGYRWTLVQRPPQLIG